ncbi:MAG: RecX family transcriptional regulator [bacterium]
MAENTEKSFEKDRRLCLKTALKLLGRREHFTLELKRKLLSKKHPESVVNIVADELTGTGYLDDTRALEHFASEVKRKKRGLFYFRKKVSEKAGGEICEKEAFEFAYTSEEEKKLAAELFEELSHDSEEKKKRFLYNRGFSAQIIREVAGDS